MVCLDLLGTREIPVIICNILFNNKKKINLDSFLCLLQCFRCAYEICIESRRQLFCLNCHYLSCYSLCVSENRTNMKTQFYSKHIDIHNRAPLLDSNKLSVKRILFEGRKKERKTKMKTTSFYCSLSLNSMRFI